MTDQPTTEAAATAQNPTNNPPDLAPTCSSIHESVLRQDRRSVAWYLQRQPECVIAQDEDSRTPLLLAAAAGDAPTCQLLLRRMAAYDADSINWADAGGLTPLHWALTQQRYDAAALLLRHGANCSAEDEDGRRPLHAAAFSGNARCVGLLLPHVTKDGASAPSADNLTPLHYAALSGAAPVVTLLLEAGANLHAVDEEGRSALSWAAGEGHASVVAALLGAKADPTTADANGMGALHHAAKAGSLQSAQLLLAGGASALQRSVGGSLAEDIARQAGGRGAGALVDVLKQAGEAEAQQRQAALLDELMLDEQSGEEGGNNNSARGRSQQNNVAMTPGKAAALRKKSEKKKRQAAKRQAQLLQQQQASNNYNAVAAAAEAHFNAAASSDEDEGDETSGSPGDGGTETDLSNAATSMAASVNTSCNSSDVAGSTIRPREPLSPRSPRTGGRDTVRVVDHSAERDHSSERSTQPAWQTPRPPADRPKADWSIHPSPRAGAAADAARRPTEMSGAASTPRNQGPSSTGALKTRPGMRTTAVVPALPPLQHEKRQTPLELEAAAVRDLPSQMPQTPGRTPKPTPGAAHLPSPSGALSARASSFNRAPAPPQPPTLSPSTSHRRSSYDRGLSIEPPSHPPQKTPPQASALGGGNASQPAQWPSRVAVATPQSVSSWLKDANVEQRRALAQFLTQLGPGANSAEKASARARQVNSNSSQPPPPQPEPDRGATPPTTLSLFDLRAGKSITAGVLPAAASRDGGPRDQSGGPPGGRAAAHRPRAAQADPGPR